MNKEQFFQNGGGSIADVGNKISHKKGHHKSGFQNHYHKDEQGSNSSFFDDGADEGDQYVYNTQKGTYGNMGQGRHRTGNMNNMHYANEGAKRGLYDQANAYEKDRGNNQQYQRNNHYDGREHAGQQNLANDYGEAARYQEERYVDRPPYGYPHPPYSGAYHTPPVGKRRITIYEDPRYIEPSRPYRRPSRYADDYLELDVRPVARHYVGRRLPPPPLPPRGYY
ncbi:hypothetical protein NQ315_011243 [Exocentrus adspersus]|uniref:Uncharacterized protein n=1 Tax=Exocentrus adspersus TaxID=1586481 RepID=A0AAV8V8Q7_9CUCU|nr:hypothetical protein NQ315_011243 [Exocentrus adspersus]